MKKSFFSANRIRQKNKNQLKKKAAEMLATYMLTEDSVPSMTDVLVYGHRGLMAMPEKVIKSKLEIVRLDLKKEAEQLKRDIEDAVKNGRHMWRGEEDMQHIMDQLKKVEDVLRDYADYELLSVDLDFS